MAEMSIINAFKPPSVIDSANWTILHLCLPAEGIGNVLERLKMIDGIYWLVERFKRPLGS
jgi:hypothetical protein